MNSESLCLALMRADTEAEVIRLLRGGGYWDHPRAWRPIGDVENNFSTIGNQQSEAVAALIEKIVNGVDSRLIDACLSTGVDPADSAKVPRSIREAVARFFEGRTLVKEHDGRIAEWTDKRATEEGRLLTVAATGHMPGSGRPSISIADQGEGQTADSFPDTFMSLQKSNRLRIPFVQGKFNMGGTGALQFCGHEHKVQLVVSRRSPALVPGGHNPRDAQWGFTIVRREPPSGGAKNSVFTYLAPIGASETNYGKILTFSADEWPIFPEADDKVRDAYARSSTHGSLIKLYEYDWQGPKSNIVYSGDGLLRRIDVGLPELALPVRLFECRPGYRGHSGSFATNALGLVARLDRDRGANLEPESPIGGVVALGGRQIKLRAYVFQPDKAKQYRNLRHGVVFHVNGQMHGAFTVDFFRRKAVNMGYLADSLLVVADCTSIDGQMREDLFMNSRDRLRDTDMSRKVESSLESFLKNEPTLRELQNRRRQAALNRRLQDDKPLADVLQGILESNPMLAKLLLQGLSLSAPFPPAGGTGTGTAGKFEGKRFPTFFRLRGKKDNEPLVREAHLGTRVRVAFETNAEDDYFVRDDDPGAWNVRAKMSDDWADDGNWTTTDPKDGVAQLWIDELPAGITIGDRIDLLIEITDPSRIDAFVNSLTLVVQAPATGGRGDGKRTKSANTGKGEKGDGSTLALPEVARVTEEQWKLHGFNEESALKVVAVSESADDATDVYDFCVNVDNKYLRIGQKEGRQPADLLEKQFMYGLVLVGLSLLQDHQRHVGRGQSNNANTDGVENIEATVATTTRALAPILLPLIEVIGGLSAEEA